MCVCVCIHKRVRGVMNLRTRVRAHALGIILFAVSPEYDDGGIEFDCSYIYMRDTIIEWDRGNLCDRQL